MSKRTRLDRGLLVLGSMRLSGVTMLLALCVWSACVTPSIPIPPPDPTDIDFDVTTTGATSTAVMTYPATSAYIGGTAYVFDTVTGQGVFQRANADGSIGPTLPLPASIGDAVVVSVTSSEQQTVSTCVVLQQGPQSAAANCP
jgi:hypothetical protein